MNGTVVREGPPLRVVAPFFIAAPLGLALAGFMLVRSSSDAFLAVNVPTLVAATHAMVLGCLALSIMGAVYQLGPAVFHGRVVSLRLISIQFWIHVVSVAVFVGAVQGWHTGAMGAAGIGLAISFALFLVNALPAVRWFRGGSLPRLYLSLALSFLMVTAGVGLTFVGAIEHGWFGITQGRLAAHAHLGLVGWLALTVMGVSYQLVPMFHVVPRRAPRFGYLALFVTVIATVLAGALLSMDVGPSIRVPIAMGLAAGPTLWAVDITRLLRARSRRVIDIHGRATAVSLGFLALAIVLGLLTAIGDPVAPNGEPARLQLAYGDAGVAGWIGVTLVGNSFKIVPFLVWNARYRAIAGYEPVPMVADLSSELWAHSTLVLHAVGVLVVVMAALTGSLPLLRSGGAMLVFGGLSHFGALAYVVLHRPLLTASSVSQSGQVSS